MIVIKRDSGYADRIRGYSVILDEKVIGSVNDGQTKKFEVDPGTHTLYLKIDWCRSNKVTFESKKDGVIHFNCASNIRGAKVLLSIFYVFLLFKQYIKLEQVEQEA